MKASFGRVAVDSSYIVAIMLNEDGLGEARSHTLNHHQCLIGVPSILEIVMVMKGRFPKQDSFVVLEEVLSMPNLNLIPFDEVHLKTALSAFSRFGKGSGHPAGLNYGDCLAYAIAKVADVPLLFIGMIFCRLILRCSLPESIPAT